MELFGKEGITCPYLVCKSASFSAIVLGRTRVRSSFLSWAMLETGTGEILSNMIMIGVAYAGRRASSSTVVGRFPIK
jgi:hypothetical protein